MSSNDDYEVGYGKPPKHSQFKPGQPRNRKKVTAAKQSKSFRELSLLQGNKRRRVQLDGKMVTLTQREIAVMAQWAKSMKGDPKAFQIIQGLEEDPKWKGAMPFDPTEVEFEVTLVLEEDPPAHIRTQQIANGYIDVEAEIARSGGKETSDSE